MELKNKKILFLGDSITEGVGASSPEKCYVSVFGKLSGAEVKNYGIGGTRIAKQSKISLSEESDRDFMSRVDEMDSEADVVVVFGGTNDFGHGDSTIGDFSSRDECTFYGALHILCTSLINKYPKADITRLIGSNDGYDKVKEKVYDRNGLFIFNTEKKNGLTASYGIDIEIIDKTAPVIDLSELGRNWYFMRIRK